MSDFFTLSTSGLSPTNNVVISNPGNGATIAGAVHLMASASESQAVSQTQVCDNGVKLGIYATDIDVIYNLAPEKHTTTILDLDTTYRIIHQSSVTYNVEQLVDGVQIISPTANESIGMYTVHLVAHANESTAISQMQVWDNGVKLGWYPGADVNQYYNLAPGSHTLTVVDLDSRYNVLHWSSVFYHVQ
jgi:phosphatidylinositol-3-phosphatase